MGLGVDLVEQCKQPFDEQRDGKCEYEKSDITAFHGILAVFVVNDEKQDAQFIETLEPDFDHRYDHMGSFPTQHWHFVHGQVDNELIAKLGQIEDGITKGNQCYERVQNSVHMLIVELL
jgi:hypothetical protein